MNEPMLLILTQIRRTSRRAGELARSSLYAALLRIAPFFIGLSMREVNEESNGRRMPPMHHPRPPSESPGPAERVGRKGVDDGRSEGGTKASATRGSQCRLSLVKGQSESLVEQRERPKAILPTKLAFSSCCLSSPFARRAGWGWCACGHGCRRCHGHQGRDPQGPHMRVLVTRPAELHSVTQARAVTARSAL
jgi:hypothetical protein